MHQPVMVLNKQENCTDFPYKPLLQVELANGSLEREVCADTLMHGKEIMYCILIYLENCLPQIVRCITLCMRNGRHCENWLGTTKRTVIFTLEGIIWEPQHV